MPIGFFTKNVNCLYFSVIDLFFYGGYNDSGSSIMKLKYISLCLIFRNIICNKVKFMIENCHFYFYAF
jgi:hypothetical protein